MTEQFSHVVETPEEAHALVDAYLSTLDEAVFAPIVRGMTTGDDEQIYAMMSGSDNEMSLFNKALYLFEQRKLLTGDEQVEIIRNVHRVRAESQEVPTEEVA